MLTLVWRGSALDDLRQITSYIAERNVAAAEHLQAAIEACAERLPEHPSCTGRGASRGRGRRSSIRTTSSFIV
jgi:plasmid stabilization system protein ParE